MTKLKRSRPATPAIRCAVYTWKSTDEGLDLDFNSLDAQRESGEAYIKSQSREGWVCLPDRYDDGDFTGGNMDRPALQRLLADIEAGKVDCVVVYKAGRLSRSLLDFSKIMETLDSRKVSFLSVTQLINSSHSMGRLMLNVHLSFAQFEREIISERTRDSDSQLVSVTAGTDQSFSRTLGFFKGATKRGGLGRERCGFKNRFLDSAEEASAAFEGRNR